MLELSSAVPRPARAGAGTSSPVARTGLQIWPDVGKLRLSDPAVSRPWPDVLARPQGGPWRFQVLGSVRSSSRLRCATAAAPEAATPLLSLREFSGVCRKDFGSRRKMGGHHPLPCSCHIACNGLGDAR